MPFWPLAASTLPSGMGPPITVRVGRAFDEHAVEAVADGGLVVGAQAEEVGLNRRVVGVGDAQAVAAVAADHVVEHERVLLERAADERVAVGVHDRHAVEAVAQRGVSRGGGADEVAAELVLRGPAGDAARRWRRCRRSGCPAEAGRTRRWSDRCRRSPRRR